MELTSLLFAIVFVFNFRAALKLLIDWKGMLTTCRFVEDAYEAVDALPDEGALEQAPGAPVFLHLLPAFEEPEITTTLGAPLVVCTAGSDHADLPPGVRRLSAMDILTVAAVIERARVFVGTDGGLTHVAAALGVPTVAVHLGYPPAITAPLGANVAIVRQSRPFEDPRLTTPAAVFETLRGLAPDRVQPGGARVAR